MNPVSLKIEDKEIRSNFEKMTTKRAHSNQYHILAIFITSFLSSVIYFFIQHMKGADYMKKLTVQLYSHVTRLVLYLIVMILSIKVKFFKDYGILIMILIYTVTVAEFSNIENRNNQGILK